jgi:hypothetical protein
LAALRGARHVDGLLKSGKIVPMADATLDAVYADVAAEKADKPPADAPVGDASTERGSNPEPKPTLIVTRDSLGNAMRALEMKPDEAKDVLRAYEQAMNRIR